MKDKGFKTLFIIYLLLLIGDMYTSFMGGPERAALLEANPIYPCVGFTGIIILNIAVLAAFWHFYNNPKSGSFARYTITLAMISVCLTRVVAIRTAISWASVDITTIKTVATPALKAATAKAIAWLTYTPILISLLTYAFWRCDHDVARRKNNTRKKDRRNR